MDKRYFSDKVVEWYRLNKRDLPWRNTKDPYKIWLSEIILQQTRVVQGLPYYIKFVEKFPTVKDLANASEQEVLRLWQGLGYYTRGRNLHKCAKIVVTQFKGVFPTQFDTLLSLPGIGHYTAAAIASFSSKQPVAVVDGNVLRVLARVFGIEKEINGPEGKALFTTLANELISQKIPDEHNQAIMEFGALNCTPKNPDCQSCVLVSGCVAAKNDLQKQLPVKIKGKTARNRYFNYVVFKKGKSLLMKKREGKDIWQGLFDFYLIETKRSAKSDKLLHDQTMLKGIKSQHIIFSSKKYKHVLSHQIIQASFIVVNDNRKTIPSTKGFKYYSLKQIDQLPKPVLITRFLKDHDLL
ncbi:MAG TPA: A/G-specific adenine glycosylase [Ohtaekwangia sp.]